MSEDSTAREAEDFRIIREALRQFSGNTPASTDEGEAALNRIKATLAELRSASGALQRGDAVLSAQWSEGTPTARTSIVDSVPEPCAVLSNIGD